MNYRKLLLFGFLLFIYSYLFAQKSIAVYWNSNFPAIYINENGEELFELEVGHWTRKYKAIDSSSNSSYSNDRALQLIKGPGNIHYFINSRGEKVLDFGRKYNLVKPFSEGGCVVRQYVKNYDNHYSYLNTKGEPLFFGQNFFAANSFSEGLALVQFERDGAFGYIDHSGKLAVSVIGWTKRKVLKLFDFSEGLAVAKLRHPIIAGGKEWVFMNKEGKFDLIINKLFPQRKILKVGPLRGGMSLVKLEVSKYKSEKVFIDRNGKTLIKFGEDYDVGDYKDGLGWVETRDTLKNKIIPTFFNSEGEEVGLALPDGQILAQVQECLNDHLILKVEIKGLINYAIHRLSDLEQVFLTEGRVLWFDEDRILIYNHNIRKTQLMDFEKNIFWESDRFYREFKKIDRALKYKDQVRYYKLMRMSDFEDGLFELKNLEHLNILGSNIKSLPKTIEKLKELKYLGISLTDNLTELPKSLTKLHNLSNIKILMVQHKMENLEYIIENAPALKEITVAFGILDNEFIEKMKTQRPDLHIITDTIYFPPPPPEESK